MGSTNRIFLSLGKHRGWHSTPISLQQMKTWLEAKKINSATLWVASVNGWLVVSGRGNHLSHGWRNKLCGPNRSQARQALPSGPPNDDLAGLQGVFPARYINIYMHLFKMIWLQYTNLNDESMVDRLYDFNIFRFFNIDMIWINIALRFINKNINLQVKPPLPRARYGYMDWSIAALVTLGVAQFLLVGPTESHRTWIFLNEFLHKGGWSTYPNVPPPQK